MSSSKAKVEYKVQLLDDSVISCRVDKGAKGEQLLAQVCTFLELDEREYFGLCFFHSKQPDLNCWLQCKKPISKQIGGSTRAYFKFRVKFYPPDPTLVKKELTKYLFVCQLKKDIAADKLICSVNTECQLAAYALQAETGDFDGDDGDLAQLAWFLKMSPNMETVIRNAYKALRGISPLDADIHFLEIARKLESYGVHQYEAVDRSGITMQLAAVWNGVIIFRCGTRQSSFPWSQIYKLDFKGRHFYIIFKNQVENSSKSNMPFKFPTKQSSKLFWRRCVEYHAFSRSKRREFSANKNAPSRAGGLTRGAPGRSTIAVSNASKFTPPSHSTPRSREAEDIQPDYNNVGTGGRGEGGRGYSTLPHSYRNNNQVSNHESASHSLNTSIVSVDSGSYQIGTSQEFSPDILDDVRSSSTGLENDIQNNEEFAAIFKQINQELVPKATDESTADVPVDVPVSDEDQYLPPPLANDNNHISNSNVRSRSSSRGSLFSSSDQTSDDPDIHITVPLDLILDVGKSMPDAGFNNYLSRLYTKTGYSRLHAVAQEYIYTEKTYVKMLGLLNTFLREITIPNGPFTSAQTSLLSNFYEMHQKFLRQLEDRLDTWQNDMRSFNIADILARNLCLFSLYSDYINDYNCTMEKFNEFIQDEPVFAKHVAMFEGRASSVISIPSLLFYPVLRVKQYQDLIEQLIGCVGENDPSYPDFNDVYHEINKNTPPLPQVLPKIMNSTMLQNLESELSGIKDVSVLGRVFLRRGLVKHIVNGTPLTRTLILLSDCLLYCTTRDKSTQVVSLLPVKEIEIEETGSQDDNVFTFVITVLPSRSVFEFYVDDKKDREKWVHDVIFASTTYNTRRKPEFLPTLVQDNNDKELNELCMVCGITLNKDKRHRSCRVCSKVLCTRCSSWKIPVPGYSELQRVCESCYSRGESRSRDVDVTQFTIVPPNVSYGGDDVLTMEQMSGYVYVRSQNRNQWRKRWLELIFSKLYFYESDTDAKPLGSVDMLHLEVADTRYEDYVNARYAFKITNKSFNICIATDTRYSLKRWLHVLNRASLLSNGKVF